MRSAILALASFALLSSAPAADAVLRRFNLYTVNITESPAQDPQHHPNNTLPRPLGEPPYDVAMIEETPNPVLRKLQFRSDGTTSSNVPGLSESIFLSNVFWEGPEAPALRHHHGVPQVSFTGTGATSVDSSIRWGVVTGWTITGSAWCQSHPPLICALAGLQDQTTTDPRFNSEFYDLGTWIFHGTGFTSIPFIHSYFSSQPGNNQHWVRGFDERAFSVPALPLIGVIALGGSFAAGGLAALRRRRL